MTLPIPTLTKWVIELLQGDAVHSHVVRLFSYVSKGEMAISQVPTPPLL